jgi:thiosulfate dehydrogenase [quinone] large subunit
MNNEIEYRKIQLLALVATRILMGWYCLYEGVIKLMSHNWTSFAFLNDSQGWFAPVFRAMAANQNMLAVVDFLNIWGLIAIGLGLILGLFTRLSAIGGMVLIGLYYLSHPALIGAEYMLPSGESTMWVGKNLIFVFILFILIVFPTGRIIGIDRLLFKKKKA